MRSKGKKKGETVAYSTAREIMKVKIDMNGTAEARTFLRRFTRGVGRSLGIEISTGVCEICWVIEWV